MATEPDSTLEFSIDSRVAGSPDGSSNRVVLSYLASYDPAMGIARVACVSGCECAESDIDALWEEKASILYIAYYSLL